MNYQSFLALERQQYSLQAAHYVRCGTPRTLMFGYTTDRFTFHVYVANELLHKLIYDSITLIPYLYESAERFSCGQVIPDKRAYPERCDFQFCRNILDLGFSIPFAMWNDDHYEDTLLHGITYEACQEVTNFTF